MGALILLIISVNYGPVTSEGVGSNPIGPARKKKGSVLKG